MVGMTRLWLGVATVVLTCGCDPGFVVTGRVLQADGGGNATTTVRLLERGNTPPGPTGDGGYFTLSGVGCLRPNDRVETREGAGATITCTSTFFMCGAGCVSAEVLISE